MLLLKACYLHWPSAVHSAVISKCTTACVRGRTKAWLYTHPIGLALKSVSLSTREVKGYPDLRAGLQNQLALSYELQQRR